MSQQHPKSIQSSQLEQTPISKRQYNVALQALELAEGEREDSEQSQRLLRRVALSWMPKPPPILVALSI